MIKLFYIGIFLLILANFLIILSTFLTKISEENMIIVPTVILLITFGFMSIFFGLFFGLDEGEKNG